jgi:hypothetical protein
MVLFFSYWISPIDYGEIAIIGTIIRDICLYIIGPIMIILGVFLLINALGSWNDS